jgi:ceramide synthetase
MTAKEKYDNIWNQFFYACFGLTLVGIFYMVKGVNNFRNKLISLNPSYEFSKYSDFLICIPLALIINMTQHYMPKLLKNFVEKVMKKAYRFPKNEKDRQLGEKYRIRLPIHIFKGSMYIFFTLFGYYVLKDINYFPKSLLGKGWLPNMFIKGYPDSFYLEKPPYFDFYYMFCLSFFISDLIGLFREDKQTDFINMLLHHVCTISLIVFSHLVHYSNVGSIVLFLHMESDVFVHVTRFFLQTDAPEIIKDINGLFLVFNFIYTRTYVLGDIIYVLYMYVTWKGIIDWFLLIFLTLIFIMNFNWALMLLQKMFALFMGTKLNDTRDFKVNANKEKEKKVE